MTHSIFASTHTHTRSHLTFPLQQQSPLVRHTHLLNNRPIQGVLDRYRGSASINDKWHLLSHPFCRFPLSICEFIELIVIGHREVLVIRKLANYTDPAAGGGEGLG